MTNENEENQAKKVKRLLDSEAETRAEPVIEPKKDEAPKQEGTTKAHAPNGERSRKTPTPPSIALDKDNMPLPRRVHEVDIEGTRVSPVAYESPGRTRNTQSPPRPVPPPIQSGSQ